MKNYIQKAFLYLILHLVISIINYHWRGFDVANEWNDNQNQSDHGNSAKCKKYHSKTNAHFCTSNHDRQLEKQFSKRQSGTWPGIRVQCFFGQWEKFYYRYLGFRENFSRSKIYKIRLDCLSDRQSDTNAYQFMVVVMSGGTRKMKNFFIEMS